MPFNQPWTRRDFLQRAGYISASSLATASLPAKASALCSISVAESQFSYVGSAHTIHVFSVQGAKWMPVQKIDSPSPMHLCLHPEQHVLYVANAIDNYNGLFCGTVEAYFIDTKSGKIALAKRQKLSLSGICPEHLAVSPDGQYLAVAVSGGGAYNVLALDRRGIPEGVITIFKDIGSGTALNGQGTAHPRFITFDKNGCLLAADAGCSRISSFAVGESLVRRCRVDLASENVPGAIVLNPAQSMVYVVNEQDGSLSGYQYEASTGTIGCKVQHLQGMPAGRSSIVIHPAGNLLYYSVVPHDPHCAGSIHVIKISPDNGSFSLVQTCRDISAHEMAIDKNGEMLFAIAPEQDAIYCASIERCSGMIGGFDVCAYVKHPVSMVLRVFELFS
jgi:6-phosphogluconolactonase (cycloisomerase 2 family)